MCTDAVASQQFSRTPELSSRKRADRIYPPPFVATPVYGDEASDSALGDIA